MNAKLLEFLELLNEQNKLSVDISSAQRHVLHRTIAMDMAEHRFHHHNKGDCGQSLVRLKEENEESLRELQQRFGENQKKIENLLEELKNQPATV
jgi:TolA-binding protein